MGLQFRYRFAGQVTCESENMQEENLPMATKGAAQVIHNWNSLMG